MKLVKNEMNRDRTRVPSTRGQRPRIIRNQSQIQSRVVNDPIKSIIAVSNREHWVQTKKLRWGSRPVQIQDGAHQKLTWFPQTDSSVVSA